MVVFIMILSIMECENMNAQNATVTIDRNWDIRTIPESLYGFNGQIWDSSQNGSNTKYNNLLINAGIKVMRWPGGSWGDIIKWNDTKCYASYAVTYDQSKALYKSLGIKFQPIVNFSGNLCNVQQSSELANTLAVDWVKEGAQNAQYWEVGNESMGSWEQGHTIGSDYGNRFADFYTKMKAVNSNIKIIAVGDQNDKADSQNPGTGIWIRELLKASLKKGVVPDGFQIHTYPGSEGKYAMLHRNLDQIKQYTSDLNYMVSSVTGRGQLDYCMTEFGASGDNRWLKMIGAQLTLQYFMEMARYNWAVANVWGEIYNTSTFVAAPVWYVYAFLNGRFGQNMVQTTSDNADIRSYASVDQDKNLTFWVCNNSLDVSEIKINLSNFKPASKGEIWIMEGADGLGDESFDIMINGEVHPSEANARFMAGKQIDVDTTFVVKLPKSSFALIKLTPAIIDPCGSTEITPRMKINSGDWEQEIYAAVDLGTTVSISPIAEGSGEWRWSGPNNFADSVQEIHLNSLQTSGEYIASYTNPCGTKSKRSFFITAVDSKKCDSTYLTPYLQVSGQAWESASNATVKTGTTISFGPQPFDGTWSWTDPAGKIVGSSREYTILKIQTTGTYTVTQTNSCGTKSRLSFKITVSPTTGLGEINILNSISIYPNPSLNGYFRMASGNQLENVSVKIYNLQGVQVFAQSNLDSQMIINTGLPTGVYIVNLNYLTNSSFYKLTIKK